jgi:Spo0E like sporulation regulatory protein
VDYKILHLRKLIEEMREDLIQLSNHRRSFTDPDVVHLSQRLDKSLDEYQELQYNLRCKTTWLKWFESDDDVPYLMTHTVM